MPLATMLDDYVAAFNRGDDDGYGSCYAPDVVLRNGGGTVLRGREAVLTYYRHIRGALHRVLRIRGVVEGEATLAAALASVFTALADGIDLAGTTLSKGDQVEIESIALYELRDGLFARIEATTLTRRIIRQGVAE